jgi:hypothetical protein
MHNASRSLMSPRESTLRQVTYAAFREPATDSYYAYRALLRPEIVPLPPSLSPDTFLSFPARLRSLERQIPRKRNTPTHACTCTRKEREMEKRKMTRERERESEREGERFSVHVRRSRLAIIEFPEDQDRRSIFRLVSRRSNNSQVLASSNVSPK